MVLRTHRLLAALTLALAAATAAQAQTQSPQPAEVTQGEEVVVTATRLENPARETASSTTIISGDLLRDTNPLLLSDAFATVPGLAVVHTGPVGQPVSVYVRGAKSEQTLVLYDGIELNDPLNVGRGFDFGGMLTGDVDRVEIIRGPQSPLYGSDAMAGVIQIFPRTSTGPARVTVGAEYGSYNTTREETSVTGSRGLVHYAFDAIHADTGGFSAAAKRFGNTEKDGYWNTTVSSLLRIAPDEDFGADFLVHTVEDHSDLDNGGGPGADDPNYTSESDRLFARTQVHARMLNDLWEQKLGLSWASHQVVLNNPADAQHPAESNFSRFTSEFSQLDWQNNFYLHESHTLTLGAETRTEQGESLEQFTSSGYAQSASFADRSATTNAAYLQDSMHLLGEHLFATAGARIDDHEYFGTEPTFRLTATGLFNDRATQVRGTFGSGFKAPSLYQLFSSYGNPDLAAEKSRSFDLGLEQRLTRWLSVSATYFHNRFSDMIDYDYATSRYMNVARAVTRGVELSAVCRPAERVTVTPSFTYTEAVDEDTQESLLRRPKNRFGLDVGYAFSDRGDVHVEAQYTGARPDMDFSTYPARRIDLPAYTVVNLSGTYRLNKRLEVYSRVENLFDKQYEEIFGYGTPGLSAYAGFKLSL